LPAKIHDDLGAKLTALKMDLQWLERKAGRTGKKKRAANTLLDRAVGRKPKLANEAILTVQRLARESCGPTSLDKLGLAAAFQFAVRGIRRADGHRVHGPGSGRGNSAQRRNSPRRFIACCRNA